MATTDNELNDLIINDISQEEYDNLVATGQVQEGQIYATDGAGGGGGGSAGGLESVATDRTLKGSGTSAAPLGLSSETITRFEDIEKVIPGHASEDDKLCTYGEMQDNVQVVRDELTELGDCGLIIRRL